MICPDLNGQEVVIKGSDDIEGALHTMHFVINKCSQNCIDGTIMNDFIDETFIREYQVQNYIDFNKYTEPPMNTKVKTLDSIKLNPVSRVV